MYIFCSNINKAVIHPKLYVDELLTRSETPQQHILDINETPDLGEKYNMKQNPLEYSFRVESRNFLGFLITPKDIKINPKKSMQY